MYASSANKAIVDEAARGKLLIYTENNSGPNTDPCGTPDVVWATEDIRPSIITRWVRFFKKFSVYLRFLLRIP